MEEKKYTMIPHARHGWWDFANQTTARIITLRLLGASEDNIVQEVVMDYDDFEKLRELIKSLE